MLLRLVRRVRLAITGRCRLVMIQVAALVFAGFRVGAWDGDRTRSFALAAHSRLDAHLGQDPKLQGEPGADQARHDPEFAHGRPRFLIS